jgi:hypothetical protein
VRGDELDVTFFMQLALELLAVPSFVADQLSREHINERSVESSLGENNVVSGSFSNNDREWKTMAVCERHDLRGVARATFSDTSAPFFAST